MTKEEILAMEAGRKLDGLVGKEIMGIEVEYPFAEGYPFYLTDNGKGKRVWDTVAFYSTDISAAGQIVEKDGAWDIKKRYRPHPEDPSGSPGRPTYQAAVQISDYDPYEDELFNKWSGRSPWCWTLPEAICKAALIAKEREEGQC